MGGQDFSWVYGQKYGTELPCLWDGFGSCHISGLTALQREAGQIELNSGCHVATENSFYPCGI